MVESGVKKTKSPRNICHIIVVFMLIGTFMIFLTLHFCNVEKLQGKNSLTLIKDVLAAEEKPSIIDSIFFHKMGIRLPSRLKYLSLYSFFKLETLKFYSAELTLQEGCAVESAAIHNPNSDVFVIFVNQSNWMNSNMSPILTTVLTYPNVHVRVVNLRQYLKKTPLNDWLNRGQQQFRLIEKNSIELMRFLSLWHWGGTYLDFNTIVLRNLEDLRVNYIVANEETNHLTTSILNCFPFGAGNFIMGEYLTNYMRYFNEEDHVENYGGKILEQIIGELCGGKNISEMVRQKHCFDLNIYGTKYFGDFTSQSKLINSSLSKLFRNVNSTYVIYNRNQSWDQSVLSMKNCPKVYRRAKLQGH